VVAGGAEQPDQIVLCALTPGHGGDHADGQLGWPRRTSNLDETQLRDIATGLAARRRVQTDAECVGWLRGQLPRKTQLQDLALVLASMVPADETYVSDALKERWAPAPLHDLPKPRP
jgi:hypothetical protein